MKTKEEYFIELLHNLYSVATSDSESINFYRTYENLPPVKYFSYNINSKTLYSKSSLYDTLREKYYMSLADSREFIILNFSAVHPQYPIKGIYGLI